MYKILYVIDTVEVGGAERSLLEIARRMDRARFELVVCHPYVGSTLQREFTVAGARVIGLQVNGKYRFLTAARRLAKVVRQEQPDLIHTTLFRADQIGRAVGRWFGIPVISSFVNLSYDASRTIDNPSVNPSKLRWLRRLDSFTARWVTRFHAVSETVKQSNCEHLSVPTNRVTVIPRGREISAWATASPVGASKEKSAGGTLPIIVNVGRLVDQKGQRYLIQAMPTVVRQFPQARLLIVGEGPLHGDLECLRDRLGLKAHVNLLGHRDDIRELLNQADCFAFPSIYEGLPGAVIEAMLAGVPIAASNIAVVREAVDQEKTGLLFEPRNPSALADAILRLIRDQPLARRLGRQAQAVARERYDINHITRQTEALYDEVLRDVPRRWKARRNEASRIPQTSTTEYHMTGSVTE